MLLASKISQNISKLYMETRAQYRAGVITEDYCICADLQSARKERDSVQFGSCLSVFHIEIRLHVRQQTGPGHEIHLQNVVRQRRDGGKIPSVQRCTLFHNLFYR